MASKMYILIRDIPEMDIGHAVLTAAHASLSGYLTFVEFEIAHHLNSGMLGSVHPTLTECWVSNSFRKVICRGNDEQFEKAKTLGVNMADFRIMTESAFGNAEVAIVFRPVDFEDPNRDKKLCGFLQGLKIYK